MVHSIRHTDAQVVYACTQLGECVIGSLKYSEQESNVALTCECVLTVAS